MNGFGLEFFIETPSDEIADSVEDIKTSWQFQLLYTVSQLAAGMQLQQAVHQQQSRQCCQRALCSMHKGC